MKNSKRSIAATPSPLKSGEWQNRILVNGVEVAWDTKLGQCTFRGIPVALMWVDTTLAGIMAGMEAMVGPERFMLALQSEGRKSVESDWMLVSRYEDFREGFAALNINAAVAGWGDWQLINYDPVKRMCIFRAYGNWEGLYQRALRVCWGSGMLAGKFSGICSKLFKTSCWATQTTFVAKGDAFDEFVVSPSGRAIEDEIERLLVSDKATRADMAVAMQKLRKTETLLRKEIEVQKKQEVELSQYKDGLAQLVNERTQELDLATNKLQAILDFSPVGIGWTDDQGGVEYVNAQFTKMFGYTVQDIPTINHWAELVYPDEEYRTMIMSKWSAGVEQSRASGRPIPTMEIQVTCKNGDIRRVIAGSAWVGNRILTNFSDITDRWTIEQREIARRSMLEMIAKGLPLSKILNTIVLEIEKEDPTSFCSILLLDLDAKHLLTGAAPSLPEFFNSAVNGVAIGENVGSCGTAAFTGERVIVEDVQTHPYWRNYKEMAELAGFRACWSEPIRSSQGNILGTFAVYHQTKRVPSDAEMERIEYAASIASIAIEHHQTTLELVRQAHFDYLTGLLNRRRWFEQAELERQRILRYEGSLSILMLDIDHFKAVNDTYGHNAGDMVLKKFSAICDEVLREVDVTGRIGGEEFAILLPETGREHALDAAERLRLAIEKTNVPLDNGLLLHFTVSIGVASMVSSDNNIDMILKRADEALYVSKHLGRNKVVSALEQS